MKLLSYARVSHDRQVESQLGLESQRMLVEEYAARNSHTIIERIVDPAISGARVRRPGLDRAMRMLHDKEADGIVVSKLDRLTRSLLHFAELLEISRKEDWAIIALDMNFSTKDPSGVLLASMLAVFGQWERSKISSRVREALAVKRARGEPLGSARIIPMETVRTVGELYSDLQSWRGVARTLNERGVPAPKGGQWFCSTARNVVTRHLGGEAAK